MQPIRNYFKRHGTRISRHQNITPDLILYWGKQQFDFTITESNAKTGPHSSVLECIALADMLEDFQQRLVHELTTRGRLTVDDATERSLALLKQCILQISECHGRQIVTARIAAKYPQFLQEDKLSERKDTIVYLSERVGRSLG